MTSRRNNPGDRWAAVFVILCGGMAGIDLAPGTRAEGLPMGKWIFYPSVDAVWQDESNLFLTNVDPEPATSYAVRPRLRWELPFRESFFRIGYAPQVRTFVGRDESTAGGLKKRYYSQFANLDTKLGFSNDLTVLVHDEFISDALETIHFDPGQSVPFGNNNQYHRNHADLEAVKQIGNRHGAGILAVHEFLRFNEHDVPLFLNYTRSGAGLIYSFRLSPLSQLKASYALGGVDQDRPGSGSVHFRTDELTLKLTGSLGRNGLTESLLGYAKWNFSDSGLSDFSGLVGEFRYQLLLSERMKVTSSLSRYPLQSFFNVNEYYVTRNIEVRLERQPASHLYYAGSVSYRLNNYPEPLTDFLGAVIGPRRKDRTWRGELGVGYKFMETLRAELRYRREERQSNIDNAGFGSGRIVFQMSFGWY